MEKILFVDACLRPDSRTRELAQTVLQALPGSVQAVPLYQIPLAPLDLDGMQARDQALQQQDFSDPRFDLARDFAQADTVVIAAPYWDLLFPSVLKLYYEAICVAGLTFRYTEKGRPESLCRVRRLYYVTTSGGFIGDQDFGFAYTRALARSFFGSPELRCFCAQGLDIVGADPQAILSQAKQAVVQQL